jgi:hypothetical protein
MSRNAPAVAADIPAVEMVMFVVAVAGVLFVVATAGTVTDGFANEHVLPGGRFEQENVTVPLNPFSPATVSGVVAACPATTVMLDGHLTEKSGVSVAETT